MTETPITIDAGQAPETDDPTRLIPFVIAGDDTPLLGVRPKMAVLLRVMAALGDDKNPLRQAVTLERLLDKIVDEASAEHLRARFYDDDDHLDLDALGPIVQALVGKWYGGPTGKPSGSAPARKRSGTSSTGRRR